MTRIFTNVPSLIAQRSVQHNLSSLQTTIQRLSTGLRINSGKDDPAGLIASEMLRSDITGINQAIENTSRANNMIAIADSALNEIAGLLNDIRGLVNASANTGGMSQEMIKSNQTQINDMLNAIDQIAASTNFMGQKLLDGSLDFEVENLKRQQVQNLQITEARLGDTGQIDVDIDLRAAAEKATLYYAYSSALDDIELTVAGNNGQQTQRFDKGTSVADIANFINGISSATGVTANVLSDATYGTLITSSVGPNNDIIITAGEAGLDAGFIEIKYTAGNDRGLVVEYEESLGSGFPATINVHLQTTPWQSATATQVDSSKGVYDNNALEFVANIPGEAYNDISIHYVDGNLTNEDFELNNVTGVERGINAVYSESAKSAVALLGDVNGLKGFSNLDDGDYLKFIASYAGSEYNDVRIEFVSDDNRTMIDPGKNAKAVMSGVTTSECDTSTSTEKVLRIYVDTAGTLGSITTFADIQAAVNLEGSFRVEFSDLAIGVEEITAADTIGTDAAVYGNTHNSGGAANTLYIYMNTADPPSYMGLTTVDADGKITGYTHAEPHTANDIKNAFDLDRPESYGNERAANLFNVERSIDNDGTGVIYGAAFEKVMTGGIDGGHVVTTAQELVAALNNSKYWGTEMTQEQLKEWYENNVAESRTDPPLLTAKLAPGNHGLSTVSVFTEVAYYGDLYSGNAIQFLGPDNSRPIRFVQGGKNTPLSLDWESVPDQTDFPQGVLTSTNANAELIIQAKRAGEELDDVYVRIVRAQEDVPNTLRQSGWGEFDSGPSYAEAQLTFTDSSTGTDIKHTAFYITANDRGEESNNVDIVMRQNPNQTERVVVAFDAAKNQLQISLSSSALDPNGIGVDSPITTREIIEAINRDTDGDGLADCGFNAALSFALNPNNDGSGTFENAGLTTIYRTVGNTGDTGGHNGTMTLYLVGEGTDHTYSPTANQIVSIINNDSYLSSMFSASTYTSGEYAGTGTIDFVKDTGFATTGGIKPGGEGVLVVHLATDENGLVTTTAADLVAWWDTLTAEETHGISASLVREPGVIWDECYDPSGWGLLEPTPTIGDECDFVYDDIKFVGWSDSSEDPEFNIPKYATGTMTSLNGEDASFDLIARRTGDDFNGYTLTYANDLTLTGKYDDNVTGPDGSVIYNGLQLTVDEETKKITIFINEGQTTANDIKSLIETHPKTKQLFGVELRGDGTGKVTLRDDTLLTSGGTEPPGGLNGAKLLFAQDASQYALEITSEGYGSSQFVSVYSSTGTFTVLDKDGNETERTYGTDANVLVNGVKAYADGNDVTLSTSTLSMDFTLSDQLSSGYTTSFSIVGGGATFQIGPDVIATQQITIGIPSVTTYSLGGVSGKLYQLRLGESASVMTDAGTKLADKIVQEAIVNVTAIRGRLGSLQKNMFEPTVNVLSDTLEAISSAESDIRDADFAEESANLTRNQVLVQSSISALGIANQLPNYILSLLQ